MQSEQDGKADRQSGAGLFDGMPLALGVDRGLFEDVDDGGAKQSAAVRIGFDESGQVNGEMHAPPRLVRQKPHFLSATQAVHENKYLEKHSYSSSTGVRVAVAVGDWDGLM